MTTETYNLASLIVKIILLSLTLTLPTPAWAKTHCLVYLSFNSTLHLIKGVSGNLQILLRYFTGSTIVAFFRIPLLLFGAGWASASPTNAVLYSKDVETILFPISALKLVASSLE